MDEVKASGGKPPGSFADLFDDCFQVPRVRASVVALFRGVRVGGWEQAIYTGRFGGPMYHYDLISAYRWASEQGLPDMMSAVNSMRDDESVAVWVIRDAPRLPYSNRVGTKVITSEERDQFGLRWKPSQVVGGLAFRKMVSFGSVWREIERRYPYCWKRIARLFWGRWMSDESPDQVSWGGGPGVQKVRPLTPLSYNPVWAAFITSRVKMRLAEHWHGLKHVFVDSMLTLDGNIPVGNHVGDFRLVGTYPRGIWIRGAGQWGEGLNWIKHAGLSREGADLFQRIPVA